MSRLAARPYPLRQKVGPFIRGLLEASPLVEVAVSGLGRGITAGERAGYISRIAGRGAARHIYRAFLFGLDEDEQETLGRAFELRYEASRRMGEGAQGRWGSRVGEMEARDMVASAFILLRDGHVDSVKAQLGFACILYADGMKEHASELISKGRLGRMALEVLVSKCNGSGHVA